jgi:hypothetical protein
MKQNGTTDIYEMYFEGKAEDHSSTPPSAKVANLGATDAVFASAGSFLSVRVLYAVPV